MTKYVMVALTNAKDGRDEEFNEWYTDQHMKDILRCEGFVSGQRFVASKEQRSVHPPYKYLALYNLETDNLERAISEMLKKVNTEEMPMSDALQEERVVWTYEVLSDFETAAPSRKNPFDMY